MIYINTREQGAQSLRNRRLSVHLFHSISANYLTYTGIFVPLLHTDQFSIHRVPPINTIAVVHCIDTVITRDRSYHGEISVDTAKGTGATTEKLINLKLKQNYGTPLLRAPMIFFSTLRLSAKAKSVFLRVQRNDTNIYPEIRQSLIYYFTNASTQLHKLKKQ